MPEPTWQSSLDFLRGLHEVPAAQANAITLSQVRLRWQHCVIARTSMHDLLFTVPEDPYPFENSVRVRWASGRSEVIRLRGDVQVDDQRLDADHVDAAVDQALEWMTSPALACRHCGRPVVASKNQFEVFERMHYTCFHYLFEHYPHDPDEECTAGGCPSSNVSSDQRPEEPRDSIVEEMIDDLMASELGAQSADVRITRLGPGVVEATFDDHTYLVTVRARPRAL